MNPMSPSHFNTPTSKRKCQQGQARIALLIAVVVASIAAVVFSILYQSQKTAPNEITLSAGAKSVLRQLDAPVEIRFYSQLDTSSVPVSVQAFSGRVPALLAAYEREGGGKIKLELFNTQTNFNANTASADGIKPFNLSQGEACYLGIALIHKSQKEIIPRLAPEWEPALESDIARAIARLLQPAPRAPSTVAPEARASAQAAMEAVKKTISNPESVSLEVGKQIIREANLAEFKKLKIELDAKLKKAQQNVLQAQNEADKQAAVKQIRAVQAEQMEALSEIAAKSQAQTAALEQIKRDAEK